MKIPFDKQRSKEALTDFTQSSYDLGKKIAGNVKDNVLVAIDNAKNENYYKKLKKYNPLFPEQYNSPDFFLPNVIVIVDDAVRRGIDVCEGAIGWISKDSGVEVLHLYDEAVKASGLSFVPAASCDAFYYVDNFDRHRFIRTDRFFSQALEERLAELEHIAYSLGAKRCSVEIIEEKKEQNYKINKASAKGSYRIASSEERMDLSSERKSKEQRSGRLESEFEGNTNPVMPKLKWFAHDNNITGLIEMRLGGNQIKSKTLKLSGASFATMSQKTAYNVDCAMNKISKVKGSVSLDNQAEKESKSSLLFYVEF